MTTTHVAPEGTFSRTRPVGTPVSMISTPRQPVAPHETREYREARIAEERSYATRRAVDALAAGRPGFARYVMARSLERQLRIAGLGSWSVAGEVA